MHKHEATIRRYFDACNAADHAALLGCFTPDAVHYFPPGLPEIPWRGADTIAAAEADLGALPPTMVAIVFFWLLQ